MAVFSLFFSIRHISRSIPQLRALRFWLHRAGLYITPSKLAGRLFAESGAKWGPAPGVETPGLPDEADALDAGDGVEGLGVDGLATGCLALSGRRVG